MHESEEEFRTIYETSKNQCYPSRNVGKIGQYFSQELSNNPKLVWRNHWLFRGKDKEGRVEGVNSWLSWVWWVKCILRCGLASERLERTTKTQRTQRL